MILNKENVSVIVLYGISYDLIWQFGIRLEVLKNIINPKLSDMDTEVKLIKNKVGLLKLAEELGNVKLFWQNFGNAIFIKLKN